MLGTTFCLLPSQLMLTGRLNTMCKPHAVWKLPNPFSCQNFDSGVAEDLQPHPSFSLNFVQRHSVWCPKGSRLVDSLRSDVSSSPLQLFPTCVQLPVSATRKCALLTPWGQTGTRSSTTWSNKHFQRVWDETISGFIQWIEQIRLRRELWSLTPLPRTPFRL